MKYSTPTAKPGPRCAGRNDELQNTWASGCVYWGLRYGQHALNEWPLNMAAWLAWPCLLQLGRPMPTPRGDLMCTSLTLSGKEHYVVVGGYYDPTGNFLPGAFR